MARKRLPDKNFIWTAELAYIVGLITTDGSLSSDGRHMIMRSSLNVKGRIHEAKPVRENTVSLYILKFGKKESLKLLAQIYYDKNIPALARKRRLPLGTRH